MRTRLDSQVGNQPRGHNYSTGYTMNGHNTHCLQHSTIFNGKVVWQANRE